MFYCICILEISVVVEAGVDLGLADVNIDVIEMGKEWCKIVNDYFGNFKKSKTILGSTVTHHLHLPLCNLLFSLFFVI